MARIEFQNVVKSYAHVTALDGLDLCIEAGEFLVILGPSGAGKTTLLKLIAGIEACTTGQIRFNGQDVAGMPPAERDIAMVFENYALYPHMTVWENMATPLRGRKTHLPPDKIEAQVEKIARMLRMEDYLDRMPNQLSGGQKQRVSMGRAMVREPGIFLLDEPLSHVDAKIREDLRRELHQLRQLFKSTVIYVTHDYIEALSLGQRIAILNHGRIEQIGSPQEVYFQPANLFVASHLGQPEINLFAAEARLEAETVHLDLPEMNHRFDLPARCFPEAIPQNQAWVVGVRPHFVALTDTPDAPGGLAANIVIRENLKTELDLVLRANSVDFMATGSSDLGLREGQTVYAHLPAEHLLFFSKTTERRIPYQPARV